MPASRQFGIDGQIKGEVHKAMVALGAKSGLLSIIGSRGDTMDDE